MVSKVSSLQHEVRNYTVEAAALVVQWHASLASSFFSRAQPKGRMNTNQDNTEQYEFDLLISQLASLQSATRVIGAGFLNNVLNDTLINIPQRIHTSNLTEQATTVTFPDNHNMTERDMYLRSEVLNGLGHNISKEAEHCNSQLN